MFLFSSTSTFEKIVIKVVCWGISLPFSIFLSSDRLYFYLIIYLSLLYISPSLYISLPISIFIFLSLPFQLYMRKRMLETLRMGVCEVVVQLGSTTNLCVMIISWKLTTLHKTRGRYHSLVWRVALYMCDLTPSSH